MFQRSLPAYARVKQSRVPNAYDKTALRLEVKKKFFKGTVNVFSIDPSLKKMPFLTNQYLKSLCLS